MVLSGYAKTGSDIPLATPISRVERRQGFQEDRGRFRAPSFCRSSSSISAGLRWIWTCLMSVNRPCVRAKSSKARTLALAGFLRFIASSSRSSRSASTGSSCSVSGTCGERLRATWSIITWSGATKVPQPADRWGYRTRPRVGCPTRTVGRHPQSLLPRSRLIGRSNIGTGRDLNSFSRTVSLARI